jgi:hypothetical protein
MPFTFVALAAVILTGTAPGEICIVGLDRQLFLDDYVIARMDGCVRVLNQPARFEGNPIITPEFPWEGNVVVSPVVLWDPDMQCFRMYYWAQYDRDDRIFTCYATSTDGITWQKPMLGLHEGPDGTKQNNIVLRGEGRQARVRYVSIYPYATSPDERYVAMYIDNVPNLTEFIAYSPDGLNWTTRIKIGDLRGVTGEPPTANPRFFLVEQKWGHDERVDHRYRAIWRTESQDLRTWSGGKYAVQLLPDDNPDMEFYHATSHFLGTQTYHGVHLGYVYPYHTVPDGEKLNDGTRMEGTIDTELMISRDTIQWTRVAPRTPFLACGEKDAWDAGMLFVMPEVVVANEVRSYYGGYAYEHATQPNNGAIGLATMRLDGFVHVESTGEVGTLTTQPFELAGDALRLNVDARQGSVRVALLDDQENPIPGFEWNVCQSITSDGLEETVRWKSKPDLSELNGRPVRLAFRLIEDARLYAFQVSR